MMLPRLLVVCLGLAAMVLSTAAEAQRCSGGWTLLAFKDVDPATQSDSIDVTRAKGSFRSLRLENSGETLQIERVRVVYADKSTHVEDRRISLGSGDYTRQIDPRATHKFVDAVALTLTANPKSRGKSRVSVCGLQSPAAATAVRPAPVPVAEAAKPTAPAPTAPAPSQVPASEASAKQKSSGRPRGAGEAEQPGDSQVVPVFFGTDRKSQDGTDRVAFGADRGKKLVLGRALVNVPKAHQIPIIERPAVYRMPFTQIVLYREREDPARHFTLKELKAFAKDDFLAMVRERLSGSVNFKDHAVVFVHGFNTPFEFALFRTAQIAYDLKFDGAPFVYSWPSKADVSAPAYAYDRESAEQAEPYFRQFLEMVATETGARTISVIAHSMGNKLLLAVLRDIKRSAPKGVELSQVILAAPDVDRDGFEFIAREIQGVSRGITLFAASNDRALNISERFWGGKPRAGDVPAGGPLVVPGIDTIDVTATNTEMFSLHHSGYAEKTALLNDIQLLLQTGERPPERRVPILQRITTDKGDYWKYPGRR